MPRINIEVDKQKLEEIKKLMEVGGISTQKDLFDNALTLLKWAFKQKQAGKAIGALNTEIERFTELDMPALEHARGSKATL